ncbi:ABC transporter permease [Bordetella pertussis]|uniref:ABC transporter permease n=1 Tax=Bordetella pertussis TaxID=520 RepID=UPI0005DFCA5B|nr:ABC transporter permease [Bordetella pertussis]CFN32655.1 ABC transporter inner membrane protein [Bordetella pertussis]CPQ11907.1 ABC transporter inner membrane protein [Bordetella pertussis]
MSKSVKCFLYPLITGVVLVILWFASIRIFSVPNYLLPTPEAVLNTLRIGYVEGQYWPHFLFTLQSTVYGYLIGCGMALVVGTVLAESETFEQFIYPYIIALQSTPKVAIAPLLLVWFGFGMASKVVMVALMSFFPMFINTVVGIRQANPAMLDLMKAFKASRSHVFFHVKLPAASGHIFAGLQISVVLSLIGAVVSEFISSSQGLGYLIQSASVNMDVATMFACLFSLVVIGLTGTNLIRFLHRKLVFWEQSTTATVQPE